MNCLLILSLAVFGAYAGPCGLNINALTGGCGSALSGRTIFAQTPVIENPSSVFPSVIPSTSVSQSCHCLKTFVRPQIRNEIISVPTVDRVVRVVPSPVVEAVSVSTGGNTRNIQVPTYGVSGGIVEGVSGIVGNSYPRIVEGVVSNSYPRIVEGVVGGAVSGFNGIVNSGLVGNFGYGSNIIV